MTILDMGECALLEVADGTGVKLVFHNDAYAGFVLADDSGSWRGFPLHRPDPYAPSARRWSWEAVWDVLRVETEAKAT